LKALCRACGADVARVLSARDQAREELWRDSARELET
jgi:hypothetical protein